MISLSALNYSGNTNLFGSSIKHDRTIRLTIKRGSVKRELHQEWYHGKEELITIELSASQFATMITSVGNGDGNPCTIRRFNGEGMENPPYKGQNTIFNNELQKTFDKTMEDTKTLVKDAKEVLGRKGTLKVADRQELLNQITMLSQHIQSNIPFLHNQFTRSMNKTVASAKMDIESARNQATQEIEMKHKLLEESHGQ